MTKIETKNKYIEKKMNLFFFKSLRVSLSEIMATVNVKMKAKIIISGEVLAKTFAKLSILISSKTNPPMIIGMDNKKLYSALFSSSFPARISEQIVLPDLEMPGKTASP